MTTSPRLIGRQAELAVLRDALGAVTATAQPRVVLVTGEAGIGKTRLMKELGALVAATGSQLLLGRCIEFGGEVLPLAALREMIVRLADDLDGETFELVIGPSRSAWAGLVPDVLGVDEPTAAPAPGGVCEAAVSVVRRLAQRGPVVVVFEDLHWADTSTRRLFTLLAATQWIGPVLLAGTYRADELHRRHPLNAVLADVARTARPDRIQLDALGRDDVAELCRAIASSSVEEALIDDVARRSGGNPFFIEELLAAGAAGSVILSETLRPVLLARIADLDDAALEVLRVVAAGGALRPDVIADVAACDDVDISRALDELVALGMLVHDGDRVRFRHELAREAFEGSAPGQAGALHAALASALERRDPERPGQIARHWLAAHDQPRALAASVRAGNAAVAAGAAAEAEIHLTHALELWDRVDQAASVAGTDHVDLLMAASTAADHARHLDVAIDLARRAVAEIGDDEPVRAGNAWLHLRDLYRFAYRWHDCAHAVERALELIPPSPPSPARARALVYAALGETYSGRNESFRDVAAEAMRMAESVRDRDVLVHARSVYVVSFERDDPQRAVDFARQTLAMCDDSVSAERTLVALNALANALIALSRWSDLLDVGRQGVHIVREHGLRGGFSSIMANYVVVGLLELGRWSELDEAVAELNDLRDVDLDMYWGLALLRQGRLDEARPLLDPPHALLLTDHFSGGNGDGVGADVTAYVIEHDLADPRGLDVAAFTEPILARALTQATYGVEQLVAEAIGALADRVLDVEAARHAEQRGPYVDIARRWLADAKASGRLLATYPDARVHLLRAEAELSRLRLDPRPDVWTEVADRWRSLAMPYHEAHARWRAAEAWLAGMTGRAVSSRKSAVEHLSIAREICAQLGAAPLLARIDTLARQGRLTLAAEIDDRPPAPVDDGDPFGLTPREREILALVAAGHTNGEIGSELYISTKTASVHVSNILRKLHVSNRVEAAAVAHRRALVPGP